VQKKKAFSHSGEKGNDYREKPPGKKNSGKGGSLTSLGNWGGGSFIHRALGGGETTYNDKQREPLQCIGEGRIRRGWEKLEGSPGEELSSSLGKRGCYWILGGGGGVSFLSKGIFFLFNYPTSNELAILFSFS